MLGEQRHDGCEQLASLLRFEARRSAPESSTLTTRLPSRMSGYVGVAKLANRKYVEMTHQGAAPGAKSAVYYSLVYVCDGHSVNK